MKKALAILAFLCLSCVLSASEVGKSDFVLHYRFDNTSFDENYLENKQTADRLRSLLLESPRIDSIVIYSWSSPDGVYAYNLRLSRQRAEAAKQFLLANSPDSLKLSSGKIIIRSEAENWNGLLRLVEDNYHRHDRTKVLNILNAEGITTETRKWRLQQLDNGYTWGFLLRNYMPYLRTATLVCVWAKTIEPILSVENPVLKQGIAYTKETELLLPSIPQPSQSDNFHEELDPLWAVRTNLLVPGLNIGTELSIGRHWSVAADYYFPWLIRNPDNQNCFQVLGFNLEGRYWFGRNRTKADRLQGHSIGAYTYGGYYDVENHYSGNQGEFVSVGLDYLYSMPVFKDRMHLEFSLGVGYLYSFMKPYDVFEPGGKAYKTGYTQDFHWVGPTKASVSLVVPLKTIRRTAK